MQAICCPAALLLAALPRWIIRCQTHRNRDEIASTVAFQLNAPNTRPDGLGRKKKKLKLKLHCLCPLTNRALVGGGCKKDFKEAEGVVGLAVS